MVGVVLERLVIRHLYDRPLDTIVATWGISLIVSQGTLIVLGPSLTDVSTPLGSVAIGGLSYSVYRFVLMAAAARRPVPDGAGAPWRGTALQPS